MIRTILCMLISLLALLISWICIILWVHKVSCASGLRMRLHIDCTLPFNITIGSVVLIYSISSGAIMDFVINYISLTFQLLDVWVAARQAWRFVTFSGEERGRRCVLLKSSWDIVACDSFKDSTRMTFFRASMNLRVPCFLIQFTFLLPYKLLSLNSGLF